MINAIRGAVCHSCVWDVFVCLLFVNKNVIAKDLSIVVSQIIERRLFISLFCVSIFVTVVEDSELCHLISTPVR